MKINQILYIFVVPSAGEPMQEIQKVTEIEGIGLTGDRYVNDSGTFLKAGRKTIRHGTIIALDPIDTANTELGRPFLPAETRLSIVVEGISTKELNELVGKEFIIGEAIVRGAGLCDPCNRPSALSGKPEF